MVCRLIEIDIFTIKQKKIYFALFLDRNEIIYAIDNFSETINLGCAALKPLIYEYLCQPKLIFRKDLHNASFTFLALIPLIP
jgi:hypothetical protein